MKIYFAYRTGYAPNHRLLKTMEANSILDWFQQNWDDLCHDEKKLLGFEVYGFPILRLEEVEAIAPPQNLKDLEAILLENLYLNNLKVTKDAIIGFTDDDEIELVWAVFTETYAQKHPKETMLWLQDSLPTDFSAVPYLEAVKGTKLKTNGTEHCRTYYLSTVIYDGSHLEDLSKSIIIEGVSLPNLISFFKEGKPAKLSPNDNNPKKVELLFLQRLATMYSCKDLPEWAKLVANYHIGSLFNSTEREKIAEISRENLEMHTQDASKSQCMVSEHLVEISLHWEGFYDYLILFDDYWYNQHPTLAQSLLNFHEKAILNKRCQYNW